MANLELLADEFRKEGYSDQNAEARVCQDIVLKAIAESNLSRNVTIKGGVVMRSITGNIRRATQDMDLDFIRYSLNEDAIRQFIDKLNCLEGIFIKITGKIEELSQQEFCAYCVDGYPQNISIPKYFPSYRGNATASA